MSYSQTKQHYVDDLKEILLKEDRWIKVHAAEFLLWEGIDTSFVYDNYRKEEKLYAEIPQYRIGIWRVLYQASTNEKERNSYLAKIIKAYSDGPDHLHALETLAKLKYSVQQSFPTLIEKSAIDSNEINSLYIYGLWNSYYDESIDKELPVNRLIDLLEREDVDEAMKRIACYVLRYTDLDDLQKERLNHIEQHSWSKDTRLQFTVMLVMHSCATDPLYPELKQRLFSFRNESSFLPSILLALSVHKDAGNREFMLSAYHDLANKTRSSYNVDDHATGIYALLRYNRVNK